MAESPIVVDKRDHIAWITLNRPEKKNALTPPMYQALVDAMRAADADPETRVVVITGAGGNFTSGNDLVDFMNTPPAGTDSPVFHFLLALNEMKKPLMAGVQGHAIGVGTTMLLHCDLAYADDTARFQMPFVSLGLCPEGGSSLLLPRIAGNAKAAALLMFAEKFDATIAKECNIIVDTLPHATFLDELRKKALALAEKPPVSLRLTKELLRRATKERVVDAFQAEGTRFLAQLGSEEAREAFTAFFEKRKPDFSRFS